ncbi:MAG: response regulator transcription factor [Saprospiraceae bacterium]|nr:response regulator transcription factor [Candidatus Vicinibacter affinis]MBK8406208.1 response regulator transcription factor [Candidatus Vicinibacter affinis]MBK8644895.1 response regulator transcription factor [Candidatus Vicinibacter affinis]
MASILISEDHPLTLMGTKTFVQGLGHHICELCTNGVTAYNMILKHKPDIAILDINMPGMNGIEILEKLALQSLRTKVILVTMHKEYSLFNRAKELNAKGYLLKEFAMDVLEECINSVLRNEIWFSKEIQENLYLDTQSSKTDILNELSFAEKKIVQLIGKQKSSKEIASMLFVSEKTIENHRHSIMKKLNLPPEKNALLVWAIQNNSQF